MRQPTCPNSNSPRCRAMCNSLVAAKPPRVLVFGSARVSTCMAWRVRTKISFYIYKYRRTDVFLWAICVDFSCVSVCVHVCVCVQWVSLYLHLGISDRYVSLHIWHLGECVQEPRSKAFNIRTGSERLYMCLEEFDPVHRTAQANAHMGSCAGKCACKCTGKCECFGPDVL